MSDAPSLIMPSAGFKEFHPDPVTDDDAAMVLAAATGAGTPEAGRERLEAAQSDPDTAFYGLTVEGDLVAVYTLRRLHLAMEITLLAVGAEHRGRGYGRRALTDALRRAGRLPLVTETDDDALGFYKACGFRVIGRRKSPEGVVRYWLGAHGPQPGRQSLRREHIPPSSTREA